MTAITALLFLALQSGGSSQPNPHEQQAKIDPARIVRMDLQELKVAEFQSDGLILDIGGGGEGIIGRIKGQQVVAIDLYSWGMSRTPPGPLKIVMDATDLKFLDGSFCTVTSFFTLMYMNPQSQQKAVREAFRVLKPGGRMRVWDTQLPALTDPAKDVVVYPFRFVLPRETIETGYGTFFPKQSMDASYYARLLKEAGFVVEEIATEGSTFRMVATKP